MKFRHENVPDIFKRGSYMVKSQKKLRPKDVYFNREKKINRLINRFMKFVFHANLNDLDVYDETNRLRLDIKMNLDMQSSELHMQSRRRRFVYYDQLAKFKTVYSIWKTRSYPAFITRVFDLPVHLINSLEWFYKGLKMHCVVDYSIF